MTGPKLLELGRVARQTVELDTDRWFKRADLADAYVQCAADQLDQGSYTHCLQLLSPRWRGVPQLLESSFTDRRSAVKANDAVTINEMLSSVDDYIAGALQTFAQVPAVLGTIDANTDDELNTLHDRNDVLTLLSKNLREASRQIQTMREEISRMVEKTEGAA